MNSVFLIGRLTKDPELRFVAGSGKAVANFSIAVNREFSKEKKADFFRVIVWGKQAEHVANYMKKGRLVAVRGSLQTSTYEDKNNVTRYVTDIVADRVEFLDKGEKSDSEQKNASNDDFDFSDFQTVEDEDVPF
ncbi:MAG: single-stranded DNA-binding protein [Clostridiales bacterium]|nr:single-stranded DNA-binding protein [Clostridiales bacterium]